MRARPAGLVSGSEACRAGIIRAMSNDNAAALSPTIRVAAIQMVAELGDVDANLAMAERLVRVAFERGANCVILPELFSSGNAFFPHMASATRAIDGRPAAVLLDLACEGNAIVGGSFLAWRDGNVYNSFVLALPDGSTTDTTRMTRRSGRIATTSEGTMTAFCPPLKAT